MNILDRPNDGGQGRSRKLRATGAAMVFALTLPAAAQAPAPGDGQAAGPGQVIIGGQPPPAPSFQRCTEVEIGGDREYGCLNQQLKTQVQRTNPSTASPPFDARSPDVSVGTANSAAVKEQYGPNYGISVLPYRPPPLPVFPRR